MGTMLWFPPFIAKFSSPILSPLKRFAMLFSPMMFRFWLWLCDKSPIAGGLAYEFFLCIYGIIGPSYRLLFWINFYVGWCCLTLGPPPFPPPLLKLLFPPPLLLWELWLMAACYDPPLLPGWDGTLKAAYYWKWPFRAYAWFKPTALALARLFETPLELPALLMLLIY